MPIKTEKELITAWRNNPLLFHKQFFDNIIWDKQIEVFNSVRDNKFTAAKSGNTVGKSFIVSEIVLWFLTTHYPSKVITTAPTWTQIESILWKEIAAMVTKSKIPFEAEMLKTELKFNNEWFAMGLSTNEVNRFQGFHSPYLLVVIDEALGVSSDIWEAIDGLHPYRVIAIGNPLDPVGNFYNCFSSSLWNKITINGEDCVKWQEEHGSIRGLVTRDWIEERKREWGVNSPLYQSRVKGDFPTETEYTLISREWVENCRKKVNEEDDEEESKRVLGCDVASKSGESETVFTYRYGNTIKKIIAIRNQPLTTTRDNLSRYYKDFNLHSLAFDADGLGSGLEDMLHEIHCPYYAFRGGYAAKAINDRKYRNLRSQFFWIVAMKFEKGLYSLKHLPDREYEILKNQLCSLQIKRPDGRGRFQIETKEDMHARGIKSPDYADSLCYSEFAFWMNSFSETVEFSYR